MAAVVYDFSAAASTPPRGVRVVVCDPEPQVRNKIRLAIEADSGLWLLSEARNWQECEADLEGLLPELLIVRAGVIPFHWLLRLEPADGFPVVITLRGLESQGLSDHSVLALPLDPSAAKRSLAWAITEIYNRKAKELSELLARYFAGLGKVSAYPSSITVEQAGQTINLPTHSIRIIRAARKHVWIDSFSGRYLVRKSIHQIAAELDPAHFVRIHRSIIVNVKYIDRELCLASKLFHIAMLDGSSYPVGSNYRDSIVAVLKSYRLE